MSFENERIQFYLRHRDRIEEWAALRAEAAAAIDEWLASLQPEVEALTANLGGDVALSTSLGLDNPWPSFRIARRSWPADDEAKAQASVSLEWVRGRTTLRASTSPYVGLRAPKANPLSVALRESPAVKAARQRRRDTTGPWWVGYAYILPGPDFPASADEYGAALVRGLQAAWEDYAPLVDAVVRDLPGSSPAT